MQGKMIPYPFQTHFSSLGPTIAKKCLSDLRKAHRRYPKGGNTRNFELWSRTQFGNEIADLFMLPYNKKLFRIEPKNMSPSWRGVFIPRPSMSEVLRAAREGELQGQGYNATFMYPKKGGISVLPNQLAIKANKQPGVRLMKKMSGFLPLWRITPGIQRVISF